MRAEDEDKSSSPATSSSVEQQQAPPNFTKQLEVSLIETFARCFKLFFELTLVFGRVIREKVHRKVISYAFWILLIMEIFHLILSFILYYYHLNHDIITKWHVVHL